jgi:hypothetical protein
MDHNIPIWNIIGVTRETWKNMPWAQQKLFIRKHRGVLIRDVAVVNRPSKSGSYLLDRYIKEIARI